MRIFICLLILLQGFLGCGNNTNSNSLRQKETSFKADCDSLQYDSVLIAYSLEFEPNNINLDSSLKQNIEIDSFLTKTDKKCLDRQSNLNYFICTFLLKQYYFHLVNYHQGYDLLSMKTGNAKYIIESFEKLSKLESNLEMLNSRYVIDYITATEMLKNDKSIMKLVNKIKAREQNMKY